MNRRRVTSRTMDPKVVELSGMTQHELETLANAGLTNTDNLSVLEEADIVHLLPKSSILLRRKLARLGTFLARGHVVNVQTTMQNVMVTLSMPMATTAQAVVPDVDNMRGAPKIYVDALKDFSRDPIDWEEWYIGTGATLGQTAYATLLTDTGKPVPADTVGMARDRELYNMLKKALYKGTAHHIIDANGLQSGHDAWTGLKMWYGKAEVSRTLIDHYRNQLNELRLSNKVKANKYINTFILCSRKLEDKHEGYTEVPEQTELSS